jgi:hypothetical protein
METSQAMSIPNYKKIFLLDAIGAMVTLMFFLFLLIPFQPWIGMPLPALYILAGIAALFVLHSGACYFWVTNHWKRSLRLIIGGNIAYTCLTATLLVLYSNQIQPLGYLYFIGEILVLMALVVFERRVLKGSQ